ncbi:MAG: hypothetical protein HC771_25110, partial [Synechococcales cyanobacterium CRU_2_2]|nr:hypothetical protein [Synechococcales cyanobacterium CRU_2_2]
RVAAIAETADKIADIRQQSADIDLQISNQREQALLNQVQKKADEGLRVITKGASQRELVTAQSLESGLITQEQADAQSLQSAKNRIQAEIQVEQDRIKQLKAKGPLTGEEEASRVEAIQAAELQISQLEKEASADRLAARNEAQQKQLTAIADNADQALGAITAIEEQKQLAIAKLEASGLISKEAAERQKVALSIASSNDQLNAERDRLRKLSSVSLSGDQEKTRLAQVKETQSKIIQLELQAIQSKDEAEQQLLGRIEQAKESSLKSTATSELKAQLAIAQLIEDGAISFEQAEDRKADASLARIESEIAAERSRLAQLSGLSLTGDEETQRLEQVRETQDAITKLELDALEAKEQTRSKLEQRLLDKIQSDQQKGQAAIASGERAKQLKIAQLQESGLITAEAVERQKEEAASARIAAELALEERRLTQLQGTRGLTGDQEKARLEAITESEGAITQLQLQQIEARRSLRLAEENERLTSLKKSQDEALRTLDEAEQHRLILQQSYINEARKGGVGESEIAAKVAGEDIAARKFSAERRLEAERQYLSALEALPQPNDPAVARQREEEIQAARKETSAVVLDLLKLEEEAQKRIQAVALEQINIRRDNLEGLKAIASAATSNEQSLISARQRLAQSQAALDEYNLQKRIDGATTEAERQQLQIQLEQQRAEAVRVRLELERQAFELSQQKALLDAEVEATERQIALEEAIANGETERQIQLKQKLLDLAQQNLDVLQESQGVESKAFDSEQRLEQQKAQDAIASARKPGTDKGGSEKNTPDPLRRRTVSGRGGDGLLGVPRQPFLTGPIGSPPGVLVSPPQQRFGDLSSQVGKIKSDSAGIPSEIAVNKKREEERAAAAAAERAQADEAAAIATKDLVTGLTSLREFVGSVVRTPTILGGPKVKNLFTGGSWGTGELATIAELGPELVAFNSGGAALVPEPGLYRARRGAHVYDAGETAAIMQTTARHYQAQSSYSSPRLEQSQETATLVKEIKSMHKTLAGWLAQIAKQGKPSPFSRPQNAPKSGGDTIILY